MTRTSWALGESVSSSWRWVGVPALLLLASACASSQEGPRLASSAGDPGYASSYPGRVAGAAEGLQSAEGEVRRVSEEMPTWPEGLKKVDAVFARDVVDASDEAGRSRGYADKQGEAAEVVRFVTEEKDKLSQQVAGSVRYSLKEKGAADNLVEAGGSAAAYGFPKAIQKQLDERAQGVNPAHRLIDEREDELGKADAEALRKHADELARASYLVHVYLPQEKRRLGELLEDASDVRRTLDKTLESEGAVARDPATKQKRKALAETRVRAAEAALARLEADVEAARRAEGSLEEKTQELEALYQRALDDLRRKLEEAVAAASS